MALSFVNNLYLVNGAFVAAGSAFSIVRSSSKVASNAAGHWQSFPADAPALTNLGLLVETAATNVLRNSAGLGAAAGNPGTLPTHWGRFAGGGPVLSIASTGTESGLPYVDIRLAGLATSTSGAAVHFEQAASAAATQGETWTGSIFMRIVGGSLSGISNVRLNIQEANSGGSGTFIHYGADVRDQVSVKTTRIRETRTLSAATTSFVRTSLELAYPQGAATDLVLRLTGPQLEQGGRATSPIITEGAPADRAADVVSLPFPPGGHTLMVRYADTVVEWLPGQVAGDALPTSAFRPVSVLEFVVAS